MQTAVLKWVMRHPFIPIIARFFVTKEFDLMGKVDFESRFQSFFTCFRTYKMLKTTEARMKFYTLEIPEEFLV